MSYIRERLFLGISSFFWGGGEGAGRWGLVSFWGVAYVVTFGVWCHIFETERYQFAFDWDLGGGKGHVLPYVALTGKTVNWGLEMEAETR